MISYGFFDNKKAENYCKYIGQQFGTDDALVPLKENDILEKLDIRLGDRFIYFRFVGTKASFMSELSVLKPVLRIFGNFIIAIKSNDNISISTVSEVYGHILDYFGSANATDFSLGLINQFGKDDKIEVEVTAKTFFASDLTDSFNLQRLWQQILADAECGFDQSFCEAAKLAKPVLSNGVIVIKLPPVARMMLAMNSSATDFEEIFASYTGVRYRVIIE